MPTTSKPLHSQSAGSDLHHPLFAYRAYSSLLRSWVFVRELVEVVRFFWQRGRRGWAICDTWQADVYLATIISQICAYVADHTYGTPYPFFTQEQGEDAYLTYLRDLSVAFAAYAQLMTDLTDSDETREQQQARYDEVVDQMRRLFDHFSAISN